MVAFPAGPWDVPDEIGDGRPLLVVMAQDACTVGAIVETVPDLVARIYERKGSDGASLRLLRNNLVFVVADEAKVDDMRNHMLRRLALRELKSASRLNDPAEHQQAKARELESTAEATIPIPTQPSFRYGFYTPLSVSPGTGLP